MADTIDSISIELTASTQSAENSIQRVIDALRMLQAAAIDASAESRIGKSIRSIAKAAKEVDTDAGQRLARLAGGLKALSKVGDLSNLADAGKNLSGVVRAVNSIGQSGGKGLSGLANGIKQTSDALGGIKDADVSKLGAVRDALSGEMSGSLHSSSRVSESASLGGMGTPEPSFGNMAAYGAMTVFKYTADSIRDATMAYREFGAALAGGGSTVDTQFTDSMMTVFKYTADSIRDATAAYLEFQAAIGSGVPPIFTNFADDAARSGGSVRMLTGNVGSNNEGPWVADEIRDAARAYDDFGNSASKAADVIETEFVNPFANFKMKPLEDELPRVTLNPIDGSVADSVNNAAGAFGNLSSVLGGLSGVLGPIASGLIAIPKYFGGQLIKNIQSATKGLTGFFHSIVRIAKYRLIRTALKLITQGINEGIKNLYSWSRTADTTFYNSMNQIATATKYMGNSFAAMAAPLVNALAPAIDFIIDKFVDLFNFINQVIARLSGQTSYTAAKKVAAQWDDASKKSAKSAKDASDEIKRTILGFDEINKLNGKTNSGSSGGTGSGSSTDASGMFEKRTIDGGVSSFADQLKAAFDASNWQELGTLLGGKVNDLVNGIDFAGAGEKVGQAINAWFSTKYWTLDTINFTNIGSKIAEFLNNAIKEIDFSIIGALLVQKLTIIGDLVIGFFETFDMGQASEKFSNFVSGIFTELSKWLEKTDWMKLGESIVNNIVDAITGFDYADLVSSIAEFLGGLLGAAINLISGLSKAIGEKIAGAFEGIGKFFQKQIEACGGDIVGGILRGIILGLVNIGVWIVDNIFKPFIKGFKKAFGIASPAKEMYGPGEDIMNGVLQGILNVIGTIEQWIIDNVFNVITKAFTLAETVVQSLAAIGETIINTVLGGILNVMGGIVTWVATNIIKPLMDAFTKDDEEDQGEDFSSKLWEAIKGKWNSDNRQLTIKLEANKTAKDIWSTINTAWNAETRELPVSVNISTTGNALWNTFKSEWDAAKVTLYSTPKLDNTGTVLWNTLKSEWEKTRVTLYGTPKLDNTGTVLWNTFKREWDSAKSTLYASPKLDNTPQAIWNVFKREWDSGNYKVDVGVKDPTNETAKNFWGRLSDAWDATVTAVDKGLDVVVRPVAKKTGGALSGFFSKVGEWLFGKSDTPETESKVKAVAGKGFSSVGNDGKMNLTGISDTNVKIDLVAGNFSDGFKKWLTGNQWADVNSTVYLKNGNFSNGYKEWVTGDYWGDLNSYVYLKNGNFSDGYKKWVTGDYWGDLNSSVYLKAGNFTSLSSWLGDSVTVSVNLKAGGGVAYSNGYSASFASGGVISSGVAKHLSNIPHYASGTTDAHGTLFLAGEAGPEILGHVGGRTEILNQSQLASTMFAAVRSAMTGVRIGGSIENAVSMNNGDADYETMYRAMYDAFTDAMTGSNERDKEKVALMRQIAAKEFTSEPTAAGMNRAQMRANRRAGTTIVPVGT